MSAEDRWAIVLLTNGRRITGKITRQRDGFYRVENADRATLLSRGAIYTIDYTTREIATEVAGVLSWEGIGSPSQPPKADDAIPIIELDASEAEQPEEESP